MHKIMRGALLLSLLLLVTGCGEQEEVEVPEVPITYLHEQADSVLWDDMTINAITPCCAFSSQSDILTVYPYFDSDLSITVTKLLLSENNFWDAITTSLEADNCYTTEEYSFATMPNGTTVGMVPIDDETCYWVSSNQLPSGYVQAVLKTLCQ